MTKLRLYGAITAALSVLTLTTSAGIAVAHSAGSNVTDAGSDHPLEKAAEIARATTDEGPGWAPIQTVHGVGHFKLQMPDLPSHEITFGVSGRTARTGLSTGTFTFRHHAPAAPGEETWTARGVGRIVCLKVHDDHALLTAVITREHTPIGEIGPHAFYLKITDGSPDRVAFLQGPPPTLLMEPYKTAGCEDPDTFIPGAEPDGALLDAGDFHLQSRDPSSPDTSSR